MKKIFLKHIIIITSLFTIIILFINYYSSAQAIIDQEYAVQSSKINQVIQTLENNKIELEELNASLDEDYLTRARAFSYVIEKNPSVLNNTAELVKLSKLLNVDELHVSDEEGILAYSSVPKYIGLDFHDGKQMRGFLPILESDNPDVYIVQEAQPNTAEEKIMKYVGVARKDKKGIVQIGLSPKRQLEAEQRNTYTYIFSRFLTRKDETFFAIDQESNTVIGYSDSLTEEDLQAYDFTQLQKYSSGDFVTLENETEKYVVTKEYNDILIGISISTEQLFANQWKTLLSTFCYLFFLQIIIVVLIMLLLKKKVIYGIHEVLQDLHSIQKGNLNTIVNVNDTPELKELSYGINNMVDRLVHSNDRISRIIDMSDIPLSAFEYQKDTQHFFITSRFKNLLEINDEDAEKLQTNPELFLKKLQHIQKHCLNVEENIYQINQNRYIKIHLSENDKGFYGTINDVTNTMLEKFHIQYESQHDQLTHLLLYNYFKEEAKQIIESQNNQTIYAAVMIDMDAFKGINDFYGHDFGDSYLKHFAQILNMMPKDHFLISRRSGDEFCLLIHHCQDKNEIIDYLNYLWHCVQSNPILSNDQQILFIKISGGFSCSQGSQASIDDLLSEADQALYEAKKKTKHHFKEYIK